MQLLCPSSSAQTVEGVDEKRTKLGAEIILLCESGTAVSATAQGKPLDKVARRPKFPSEPPEVHEGVRASGMI